MTHDDKEIVSALRAQLADRIGWDRYEVWFGKAVDFVLGESSVCVEVATQFSQDWLRTHFRADIEAVSSEILGQKSVVEFRLNEKLATRTSKQNPPHPNQPQSGAQTGPRLLTIADEAAQPPAMERRPLASFDELEVGEGNKLAFTSARIAADRPGSVSPLLLHGPTGVGKTHLLESIMTRARQRDRRLHTVYRTAEQFTTDFFDALAGKGVPSFRQKYRGVDILVLDDVHFFANKKATLVELLYTVESLARAGRQVVLAADRGPAQLGFLGSELVGRISGGLVCQIESPDYATRLGIVGRLAQDLETPIAPDVQQLIAAQITATSRELAGAVNRLYATSLATGQKIDCAMAEETLLQLSANSSRAVRLADIEQAVCDEFGIEAASLKSGRTGNAVSNPRVLAMYLARKHTRAALSEISNFFGRRSHSTVITANKKVSRWMNQKYSLELGERRCGVEDAVRRVEERIVGSRKSG